jgi:hypothetical protein
MSCFAVQAHFTIHKDIVEQCKAKKVTPKPGIKDISGNFVTFMDGTSYDADIIICATGRLKFVAGFAPGFVLQS